MCGRATVPCCCVVIGLQENRPYSAGANNATLLQILYSVAWQAEELVVLAQKRTCSAFVLVNASLIGNQAGGAGGAVYATDCLGFSTVCPQESQPGESCFLSE